MGMDLYIGCPRGRRYDFIMNKGKTCTVVNHISEALGISGGEDEYHSRTIRLTNVETRQIFMIYPGESKDVPQGRYEIYGDWSGMPTNLDVLMNGVVVKKASDASSSFVLYRNKDPLEYSILAREFFLGQEVVTFEENLGRYY